MSDLLFISDNPKIDSIRDILQPMLKLEIVVEPNLENALNDIFSSQPSVVFIQSLIGETTAKEIAKHIRSVLEDNTPIMNLLHGSEISAIEVDGLFTHYFDMSLSQDKLAKSILRTVLKTAFRHQLQDNLIPMKPDKTPASTECQRNLSQTESDADTAEKKDVLSPADLLPDIAKEQIPDELLKGFEENYRYISTYRGMTYVAITVVCLSVVAWYLFTGKPAKSGTIAKPAPSKKAAQIAAVVSSAPAIKTPVTAKVTTAQVAGKISSAPLKPSGSTDLALPSYISEKWSDPAYSQQKPGWERYVGPEHEYRIFKSGNRITVIQVLDINLKGIRKKFLQSVLQEFSGSTTYQEISTEDKEGFTVIRGSTDSNANILIYLKNTKIRAFVVSQEN